MKKLELNKKILITSVILTFILATVSITIGILIDTSFILFAGLNMAVMIITSSAMLFANSYMRKKDPIKFPFGKNSIAPFLVFIQYTLVVVMLVISLIEGIRVVIAAEAVESFYLVLIYTTAAAFVYNVIYFILKRLAKKTDSVIVNAEVKTWRIDAILNVVVLFGLLISWILISFNIDWVLNYLDGTILIGISLFLMVDPFKEIIKNVAELLNFSILDEDTLKKLTKIMNDVQKKYGILKNYTRVTKNGEVVIIEVDFIVPVEWENDSIVIQDEIRQIIDDQIKALKIRNWTVISFTSQEKWALE